jgi:Cro/C1-type HTH DNA-binding domain
VVSAGKLSGLWSGTPNSIKLEELEELEVICAVLGCGVEELLLPELEKAATPAPAAEEPTAASGEARRAVTPRSRTSGSLPPGECPHPPAAGGATATP